MECAMTTCAVTGAAGSGKTCTMYLALKQNPPDVRQSTGLVEPVRALSTVVGIPESGTSEWIRVYEDELLDRVVGAISVTNAEEQPAVQTSTSPPTHSTAEESSSTPATPQDMHTQEQSEVSSEADNSGTPSALSTPQEQLGTSEDDKSEQVSKSECHTEVIDELLIKLAGLLKKPVGKKRVTKLDFLYFLDSGGQPQFHELLPSFVPNLSTILFVLKLSETFSQHPVVEYYQEDKSVCSYQSIPLHS